MSSTMHGTGHWSRMCGKKHAILGREGVQQSTRHVTVVLPPSMEGSHKIIDTCFAKPCARTNALGLCERSGHNGR